MSQIARAIVTTPGLGSTDGVSVVAQQALEALCQVPNLDVEVWVLGGALRADIPHAVRVRHAGSSRATFGAWGVRQGRRHGARTLFLCMHLHLAPVAMPASLRGARQAVFLHGIESWVRLRRIRRIALRRAWRLLANSSTTARRFRACNPQFEAAPIELCHLGLPTATLADGAAPASRAALIVGRLAPDERYKGHDELIEVWPRLLATHPEATLWIVGEGLDRPRLQAKARALGLEERVIFHGRVSAERLRLLLRDCAFFALPSRGEGFGLVYLEAMRAGKACLGGPGAPAEVIAEGVTGYIVDARRPDDLLERLDLLLGAPERTESLGAAGRERFQERFTNVHFQQRLLRALDLA